MAYASDIHVIVYQVLDQVIGREVPPPGAKATIHSIIDDLHAAAAPRHMIEQAEGISLQLHCLEHAIAQRDVSLAASARQKLMLIASTWLDKRIRGFQPPRALEMCNG
jgi:hypothetical protein